MNGSNRLRAPFGPGVLGRPDPAGAPPLLQPPPAPQQDGAKPNAAPMGIGWRHAHYRELIERQPPLDFLEVHSENFFAAGGAALAVLERGRQDYPVSLHGVGLSLGSAIGLDAWHLDQLARLVKRIEPVRVSDHASFARAARTWPADAAATIADGADGPPATWVHAADLLPIPFSHEALDVMCANVSAVQDRLKRHLTVENLSAYVHWPLADSERFGTEVEFLVALSRRTGCRLLVDVNNLYVNALNAQILGQPGDPLAACRAWLDAVPTNCVEEVHLAGHVHVHDAHGEIVIDDHGSRVNEAVWQLYAHALGHFGAVPTLIEWDTNVPALDVLLAEASRARLMPEAHNSPWVYTGPAGGAA